MDEKGSRNSFNSRFKKEDQNKLEKAKEIIKVIKEKYNLTFEEFKDLFEEELSFPSVILNKKLTILESVVKYLKEEKKFSLHKISKLIKRDERNVWHIYDNAKRKYAKRIIVRKSEVWIPVSVFVDTKLSALECVVVYLKEKLSLNYHNIAVLLKRDDRTIWTVYSRARKKYGKRK